MGGNSKPGHPGAFILAPIFCIPFILYGLGILTIPLFIGSLMLSLFLLFLVIRFEVGFLMIIILRSSLDYLKNFTDFNLAAFVSVALISLGVFYVLFRKVNMFQFEETAPFLIFLMVAGSSVFFSTNLSESFSDWLRLVSVFSVYILARILFVSASQIQAAFTAVFLSALLPMAAACIQFMTGRGLVMDGDQARIVGTFLHPNAFASYLLILLVFGISQWLEKEKMVRPLFLWILVPVISVIFILTFSRGAWIALVVSVIFLGAFRYRKLFALLPLALLLVMFAMPSIRDRIENIFNPGYTHGRSAWAWRQDTWKDVMPLVYQKPVLGHGLATVEAEFGVLTHNDYLRLLAETGIVGLLAYLLLMFRLLGATWGDYQRTNSQLVQGLQVGLMAMIVGFLFREFADNTLRNTVVMIYFWFLAALIRNMSRLELSHPDSGARPSSEGDENPRMGMAGVARRQGNTL